MFGRSISLFHLFGFEVKIDFTWIFIAIFVTWSLAAGVFPHYYEGLTTRTYWFMGVAGALGLFASIIVHEFCHSLVARKFGLPMKGITLFIFGGVAEMDDEPPSAKAEFYMSVAGPLASIGVGMLLGALFLLGVRAGWPDIATGTLNYLSSINFILAAFNLVPAFPLDGGRIFRSALWAWKNDIHWATNIASRIGSGFGVMLVVCGVLFFISGLFITGMWWFLIGIFLRSASQGSYKRLLIRDVLAGEPVRRFMKEDPVTVPPSVSVRDFVENYVYKHHFKMFPVTDNGTLTGCVTTRQVKNIPRQEWENRSLQDIVTSCSEENTLAPDADSMHALTLMQKSNNSRLLIVENGTLRGLVTLKDLLQFLSVKLDLEGESVDSRALQGV